MIQGDKDAVNAILENPGIQAVSFVGATKTAEYIYHTGVKHNKRVQALGGAKNHMVIMPDADMEQATDAIMGAAYGSAGERCMAISVAVAVGDQVADNLVERLMPRVQALKVGPGSDPQTEMGPLVSREHFDKVMGYIDAGVQEGADLVLDGRSLNLQGYENGYFMGGSILRPRDHRYVDLQGRDFRTGALGGAGGGLRLSGEYGERARIRQRYSDLHARWRCRPALHQFDSDRHGRRQCADPRAHGLSFLRRLETFALRRPPYAWARGCALLHEDETVTSRWPGGIRSGADFSIPVMG